METLEASSSSDSRELLTSISVARTLETSTQEAATRLLVEAIVEQERSLLDSIEQRAEVFCKEYSILISNSNPELQEWMEIYSDFDELDADKGEATRIRAARELVSNSTKCTRQSSNSSLEGGVLRRFFSDSDWENFNKSGNEEEFSEVLATAYACLTQDYWKAAIELHSQLRLQEIAQHALGRQCLEEALQANPTPKLREIISSSLKDKVAEPELQLRLTELGSLAGSSYFDHSSIKQTIQTTLAQGTAFFDLALQKGPELRALLRDIEAVRSKASGRNDPTSWLEIVAPLTNLEQTPALELKERLEEVLGGALSRKELQQLASENPSNALLEKLFEMDSVLNDPTKLFETREHFLRGLAIASEFPVGRETLVLTLQDKQSSASHWAGLALEYRWPSPEQTVVEEREVPATSSSPADINFRKRPGKDRTEGLYVAVRDQVSAWSRGHPLRVPLGELHTAFCDGARAVESSAEEFVPALADLEMAIRGNVKDQSSYEKLLPNALQAREMLTATIRNSPAGTIPRLTKPSGWANGLPSSEKDTRLTEPVQVFLPDEDRSVDGITAALGMAAGDLDASRSRIVSEAIVEALREPANEELNLREKLLVGGERQSRNVARLGWLLYCVSDSEQEMRISSALMHVVGGNEVLTETLADPETFAMELATTVIRGRTLYMVTEEPREELASILEGLRNSLRILAGPEESLPPGTLEFSNTARQIYGEDYESEVRRVCDGIRSGELFGELDSGVSSSHFFAEEVPDFKSLPKISQTDLPNGSTIPGLLYLLHEAVPSEATPSRNAPLNRVALTKLCSQIMNPKGGNSLLQELPADQFVPGLLNADAQLSSSQQDEIFHDNIEAVLTEIATSTEHGTPLLSRMRGVSKNGIVVFDFKERNQFSETSRDGLTVLLNELSAALEIARCQEKKQKEVEGKPDPGFEKVALLTHVLMDALYNKDLEGLLPVEFMAPYDTIVIFSHLAKVMLSLTKDEEVPDQMFFDKILDLGIARREYHQELATFFEESKSHRFTLDVERSADLGVVYGRGLLEAVVSDAFQCIPTQRVLDDGDIAIGATARFAKNASDRSLYARDLLVQWALEPGTACLHTGVD